MKPEPPLNGKRDSENGKGDREVASYRVEQAKRKKADE
jgi:hypothetical protein